jgi:hypothetical protein
MSTSIVQSQLDALKQSIKTPSKESVVRKPVPKGQAKRRTSSGTPPSSTKIHASESLELGTNTLVRMLIIHFKRDILSNKIYKSHAKIFIQF